MEPIIPLLVRELSDNWPAFLYIAVATAFSIRFLYERRAETRLLKEFADSLQASVDARFDRLESMVVPRARLRRREKKQGKPPE